jgi:hypothetical protein
MCICTMGSLKTPHNRARIPQHCCRPQALPRGPACLRSVLPLPSAAASAALSHRHWPHSCSALHCVGWPARRGQWNSTYGQILGPRRTLLTVSGCRHCHWSWQDRQIKSDAPLPPPACRARGSLFPVVLGGRGAWLGPVRLQSRFLVMVVL